MDRLGIAIIATGCIALLFSFAAVALGIPVAEAGPYLFTAVIIVFLLFLVAPRK